MKLSALKNRVIELGIPIASNDGLYGEAVLIGRVRLDRGDRDGPPHIKLGASILPLATQVAPVKFIPDRYTMELS